MGARVRNHIRSNVVGYVSLFFALGGGVAWATHPGGADTISSGDIINNDVRTQDIRDANLTTADIRSGAVTTGKISDGEVRSADVIDDGSSHALQGVDILDEALTHKDIQNPTRAVNLALGSFVNTTGSGELLDFTPSDGTSPDFVCSGSCGFAPISSSFQLRWDGDSDGGGPNTADTDFVSSTFTVPPEFASGGSFELRASKFGNSGISEEFDCGVTVDGGFRGFDSTLIAASAIASYSVVPDVAYAPGDSVSLACAVSTAADGLQNTYNDQVDLHSVEFRYSATQ